MGGISSTMDVVEFLMAGAAAVMVGTITFQYPRRMQEIVAELPEVITELGFDCLQDVVGSALPGRSNASSMMEAEYE
jgi:dihydroorotate dehydrogenase (NAD+) catalytic subunit